MLNIKNLQIKDFKKGLKYALLTTTLALSITGCGKNNDEQINYDTILNNQQLLESSKESLQEYFESKENLEIETNLENQIRYIKAARNLENVAENEIADDIGANKVSIARIDQTNQVIADNTYFNGNIPSSIVNAINNTEELDGYKGGNTTVWTEKDMNQFMNYADNLVEDIINMQNYDLEIEDGKITQQKR